MNVDRYALLSAVVRRLDVGEQFDVDQAGGGGQQARRSGVAVRAVGRALVAILGSLFGDTSAKNHDFDVAYLRIEESRGVRDPTRSCFEPMATTSFPTVSAARDSAENRVGSGERDRRPHDTFR